MWGHVFSRFDSTDLAGIVHKTKGHATAGDVSDGVTTAWERLANQHADRFAKKGARCHGMTEKMGEAVNCILDFQARVACFVGRMSAWMTDCELRDTSDLKGRRRPAGGKKTVRAKLHYQLSGLGEGGFSTAERDEVAAAQRAEVLTGHRLRIAACRAPERGAILMCVRCGGYSQQRVASLGREWGGRTRACPAARNRVRKFLDGRHPLTNGGEAGGGVARPAGHR